MNLWFNIKVFFSYHFLLYFIKCARENKCIVKQQSYCKFLLGQAKLQFSTVNFLDNCNGFDDRIDCISCSYFRINELNIMWRNKRWKRKDSCRRLNRDIVRKVVQDLSDWLLSLKYCYCQKLSDIATATS